MEVRPLGTRPAQCAKANDRIGRLAYGVSPWAIMLAEDCSTGDTNEKSDEVKPVVVHFQL